MKRFYLLLITTLLPIVLLGQLTKGTWLLGGSGQMNVPTIISHENGSNTYYEISLAPTLGYFLSNRIMMGLSFGSYIQLQPANESGVRSGLVNILPQVRYYFNSSNTKRNWFGLVESNLDQLRFGAGVNYFLAPGIALEGFAGAHWDGSSNTEIFTNIGLQFFLQPKREESASILPTLGKGALLLGGSGSISSYEGSSWQFTAAPNVGFFLSDRWVLGGRLIGTYFRSDNFDIRYATLGFSPFARYYLNPTGGRARWFLMADAGVERGSIKADEQYVSSGTYNVFSTSGRGGLNYFITSNVALEGTLGVFYSTNENNPTLSTTSTSNTFRLGADFGIQFFLVKNK